MLARWAVGGPASGWAGRLYRLFETAAKRAYPQSADLTVVFSSPPLLGQSLVVRGNAAVIPPERTR